MHYGIASKYKLTSFVKLILKITERVFLCDHKELGFFHIIFAQILTALNIRLTHARPSILIYANALGYILSIKVEFVMQNMMSICLCCCIWEGGLKSATSRKLIKTNNTAYF